MKKQYTIFFDDNFLYECRSNWTRDGFSHTCIVSRRDNAGRVGRWRVKYYNRTWESYRFESVINKARGALGVSTEKRPTLYYGEV